MRLFDRKALIVVDTAVRGNQANLASRGIVPALSVPCGRDGFDCRFDIHKDLTGKPNRASIQIFNLSRDHRDALSERAAKGPVRVRLDAGYGSETSRIFEGDLRTLYHDRDTGADFATHIESGDGDHIVATAILSKAWGPGTHIQRVVKDLAKGLSLGSGNIDQVVGDALMPGLGKAFAGGTAVSGRIFPELTNITRSAGLEWSIQDGTLQFLRAGKPLSATAVRCTESTGMEGAPKIDHKGKLHVKMRLIPEVWPGRKIILEDKTVWRVAKAHYTGETRGSAWGIQIQADPV